MADRAQAPPTHNRSLLEVLAVCVALSMGLASCTKTSNQSDTGLAAYEPDEVPAGGDGNLLGVDVSAAVRCATFMSSSPPPNPNTSPEARFWPNSNAGRYHEDLLRHCGDLWAGILSRDSDEQHLTIAKTSAAQFFEHCLGSMSQRKMTAFETQLYCLDIHVGPDTLTVGYPPEYAAYMLYRTADKDPERFLTVALAVCERFGSSEACSDARKMKFAALRARARDRRH